MDNISKLRTYRHIKVNLKLEAYLLSSNPKARSILFSIRSGTNKLEIERGRWARKPELHRVCKYCSLNHVENEIHFVNVCPNYHDLRSFMFQKIMTLSGGKWDLVNVSVQEQFRILMQGTGDQFESEVFRTFQSFLLKASRKRDLQMPQANR